MHRHSCVPDTLARLAFLADEATHTGTKHLCETRGLGQNSYARVIIFNMVMPPAGLCIACLVRLATCVWLPALCCLGWGPFEWMDLECGYSVLLGTTRGYSGLLGATRG